LSASATRSPTVWCSSANRSMQPALRDFDGWICLFQNFNFCIANVFDSAQFNEASHVKGH
jgi:hypothetical protein